MSEPSLVRDPKAYRQVDQAVLAGVAAGLTAHAHVSVWIIRAVFVLSSFWKFSGAVVYVLLWLILPTRERAVPIGLVAAERQGLRTVAHRLRWGRAVGWLACCLIGLGVARLMRLYDSSVFGEFGTHIVVLGIGLSLIWLARETTWPRAWKLIVLSLGVIVIWLFGAFVQARFLSWLVIDLGWQDPAMALPERIFGLALFCAGTTVVVTCFITLPWILHPARSSKERQAELIAQTRADMAAHLHDSVLQTLAVIQKRSSDAKAVAQLARRQEKELREWLYGERGDEESAVTALKDVIAELETTYPVAVELVTVGDHEMNVAVDALVRAAREAMLNAAKHSGADQIDVYAEINVSHGEIFVRDRGCGFVMEDIGEDRMGVRGSIIDRMARYGGTVTIRSTVGDGTEIHLMMPLEEEGNTYD
ncbi:MAG: PspC domain-containing protein [Propionibacteriaceae bacterium]|nr:PspC domain-containing protein [Propionibacteriaceae bacterium]